MIIIVVFGFLWKRGQITALATYVQETREELKKCSWPTWLELRGSTILIIVSVLLLGAFVVIVDAGLVTTSKAPAAFLRSAVVKCPAGTACVDAGTCKGAFVVGSTQCAGIQNLGTSTDGLTLTLTLTTCAAGTLCVATDDVAGGTASVR